MQGIAAQETSSDATGGRAVERMTDCRTAQRRWSAVPLAQRIAVLAKARHEMARRAVAMASLIERRPLADTLTSEVLPLLEAIRFLERSAAHVLAPRHERRSRRPLWLAGIEIDVVREPFGVVLIIAPSNYPLMLAGIQALQALAAGNGVVLKPAPGARPVLEALGDALRAAGLPAALLQVTGESVQEAERLCRAGADKLVLTGSAAAGRAVLAGLSGAIPTTFELSGNDAAFVRADADLDVVVAALAFALRLNDGQSCVAPRRVFVARERAAELTRRLAAALAGQPAAPLDKARAALAAALIDDALGRGARLVCGGLEQTPKDGASRLAPTVLEHLEPGMRLNRTELFAPLIAIAAVRDDDEALRLAAESPYGLGASIFTRDRVAARALARRIEAGLVTINDVVVPTADPRAPLAPRGASGHGVTRGREGLLAMTRPKAVLAANGGRPRHAAPTPPSTCLAAYIEAAYGHGWRLRAAATARLIAALVASRRQARAGKRPTSSSRAATHGAKPT
jgi:acyl-CoA reductase-like NAD-dependent aldehyde dehydrogenase